jgi:all-trans-8'-apo-beta-carotenal 15,15'-oxygenase
MSEAIRGARGAMPAWNGQRLAAAFAARRDRAWTLGYESINAPVISGQAAWEGVCPRELFGTFLRNGPARHERGGMRYAHRWDGDGMVQRFTLSPDGVSHLSRFVQTRKLLDEDDAGGMIYSGFGTPVDRVQPTPQRIEDSNPANISIVRFANEYMALWEAGLPYRIDPDSLATVGRVSWFDTDRPAPFSAHPKIATDGSLWNFGIDPLGDHLHLYHIGENGSPLWKREMPIEQIAPVHDFGVTERFLVFLLPSIICSRDRLMDGASFAESCQWSPQLGMRAIVVRKSDTTSIEFRLPPGCLFHVANAWDEGDRIHIDYMASPDPSSLLAGWSVMAGEYRHMKGATLTRATLDLNTGTARQEALVDHDAEFPSVLPADVSRPHRNVLCLERSDGRARDVPGYDRVALIDVTTAARQAFDFGVDWLVEEHLLVAGADAHTPRWAIGTALDLRGRVTVLSIFDTENLASGPVARARLPYALPLGLHGTFVPAVAA